jgi:uncharacterized membrane protein YbhN (UPF0104 family)
MALANEVAHEEAGPMEVQRDARKLRNGLIWTLVLLAMLLGVGLAIPDLRSVIDRVSRADIGWLALAVGLEVLSGLGYVATMRLVLPRAPAREVRRLAWAEQAFGAVVPVGGAGGLAVGAWAMRAWGVPWSRITNRSAVIFLLTSAVNAAVLGIAGIGALVGFGYVNDPLIYGLIPALVAFGGLAFFIALSKLVDADSDHRRLASLAGWVKDSEAVALTANWRLIGTVGYLLFDIAVLWACLRAVGVQPSIPALVLGYQIGYLANLLPVPGGVGVLEGGLLGALLLYGLPAAPTAAAVVLYHAVALWVPAIGGTYGFARLRRSLAARPAPLKVIKPSTPAQPADLAA